MSASTPGPQPIVPPQQPVGPQPVGPQYAQPQYASPEYPQPQYAQPQYASPEYPQPQYAQPQYPQPLGAYPAQGQVPAPVVPAETPRRKSFFRRHKILTTLLGVVVVVLVAKACSAGGGDEPGAAGAPSAGTHASTAGKGKAATSPGIGDAVRDGKFEFTVTKVQKGVQKVGDQYLGAKAQGQFVLVHMSVKNIGKEAQTFFDGNQELSDTKGRTFDADSEAGIYLDESNAFLKDINPGNTVKGIVVFDVPKGVQLASIELHDSAFSGGVKVALK